ncbi:MAG: MauE/DoxX family redox-associated membrane protein [bacterium]
MNTNRGNNLLPEAATVVLGLFFLLSGIGKILDVHAFRATLLAYGFPEEWTAVAAAVPPLEILLGLLLMFKRRSGRLAVVSLAALALFTLAFVYAHFAEGVQDCGCFGRISALQTSPILSISRNVILLGLALFLWKRSHPGAIFVLPTWQWTTLACVGAFAFTLSGISSVQPLSHPEHPFLHQKVAETPLSELFTASPDSTYLIFAYSGTCGSCWDAAENVKAYKRLAIVDEIYGFTYGDDADLMVFEDSFEPNFRTTILDKETFETLTFETPTAFFIQDGVVKSVQKGRIMSPVRFYEDGLRQEEATF